MYKTSTTISGILAVVIYLGAVSLFFIYFNSKERQKPIHYVKKNEDKIRVTLASPEPIKPKPTPKEKQPPTPPKASKKEVIKRQKDTTKKVIKEKVVKKAPPQKPKEPPKEKPKIINKPKSSKDLFANVKAPKKPKETPKPKKQEKPTPKPTPSPKPKRPSASDILKQQQLKNEKKKSEKGIENAYLAGVEEKLMGWPAQSEFAGEVVKVRLKVNPSGRFVFKILRHSSNPQFTKGLEAYLKQLQRMGLGRHKGGRSYVIDVEFEAKE
jgi:hypothetical protein